MRTRPRIGITRSGQADRISNSYQAYHDRIVEAGGEPVDLYPGSEHDFTALDGLLISGGPDVLPARYGQEQHPETDSGDPPRDDLEFAALAAAQARDIPILAICRGHQLLNVAYGGQLLQHIEGDTHRALNSEGYPSRWHQTRIKPESRLASLVGGGWIETNSRHHQAVTPETLAPGLAVTGVTADGLIEAVEDPSARWLVSVQWHPEKGEIAERFRPLFRSFVEACAVEPDASAPATERGAPAVVG